VVRGSGSPRMSTRETESRTVVEKTLKGKNPRRAPTGDLGLARYGVVAERTPGGSKASKWACRPLTGEPSVSGKWTVRAARLRARRGDRTSDREERRPGSCVPCLPSGGRERQRAGAIRESGRESPEGTAPAAVGERTHKEAERPARAGTAPREGKALEGSSRDASGMKEGREALGATANGGVQKASSEPRAS